MAKFEIQTARQDLGFTPATAVRANLDVSQGDVGGAIGQGLIAGAKEIKQRRLAKEAIEVKRRKMMDDNNSILANKLRDKADDEFNAFKLINPQETWEEERTKQTQRVADEVGGLDFSPDAATRQRALSEAYSEVSIAKSFTDATRKLRDNTVLIQSEALTGAFRTGTPESIAAQIAMFMSNAANMGMSRQVAILAVNSAQEAGEKLRNKDAVKAKENEAAVNPVAIEIQMTDELAARKKGEGDPALEDLTNTDIDDIKRYSKERGAEIARNAKAAADQAIKDKEDEFFVGLDDGTKTTADVIASDLPTPFRRKLLRDNAIFVKMDLENLWPLTNDDAIVQSLNTLLTRQSSGLGDINETNKAINDAATTGKLTKAKRNSLRAQAKKGGLDAIDKSVENFTRRVRNALVGRLSERAARLKIRESARELTREERREASSIGFLLQVGNEQIERYIADLNTDLRSLGKETVSGVETTAIAASVWERYKIKTDVQKIREFKEFAGTEVPRPDGFPISAWDAADSETKAEIVTASSNGATNKQIQDILNK